MRLKIHTVRTSLIISTYNAPRQLDLALHGVARQAVMPDEIFIADDGSTDETRAMIDSWRLRLKIPLRHLWQADQGFRKCRILNEAVRQSMGETLIFLDGDSSPHREWISDHLKMAKRGRVLCGRRVRLGPQLSARVTPEMIAAGGLDSPLGAVMRSALRRDSTRVLLGLRLPARLARVFHPRSRKLMGVNFSLPREALYAVNGFNESYSTYGLEDYDLEIRLRRAGNRLYPLLNRAVVYHLHHPMKKIAEQSRREFEQLLAGDYRRCENGLENSVPFDPQR